MARMSSVLKKADKLNLSLYSFYPVQIDGLVQEKCNSSVSAMELCFLALTHRNVTGGEWTSLFKLEQVEGLVQDCSDSSMLAMELLQSCATPSK